MNMLAYSTHHAAFGHFGGSIVHMLFRSMVYSVGWHVIGSLFRGQSFVGSLMIGAIVFVLFFIARRFFARS